MWGFAETALRETRSAALLADYAQAQGFRVERGVAGMPTAFVASYGEGRPVIAVLGEYDALPGLSQKAVPERAVLAPGAPGHGCGHNLFGAASLGAAVAIKELMAAGKLAGTVRYYGTPAEEAVGGKIYMIRAELFRDVDVALAWHPADRTRADMEGGQAVVDVIVEFHGRTAHAAVRPLERPERPGRGGALHPRREHDARAREAQRADALRDPGRRRRAERRARPRQGLDLGARLRAGGCRRRAGAAAQGRRGRGA